LYRSSAMQAIRQRTYFSDPDDLATFVVLDCDRFCA